MKTATIELPDALFQQLAGEAERRSKSFSAYVEEMLAGATETRTCIEPPSGKASADLPTIPSSRPGSAYITNEMIADQEIADDVEHYERVARR